MKNNIGPKFIVMGLSCALIGTLSAAPHVVTAVERYALDYIKANATDDAEGIELKKLGLGKGRRYDAVVSAVKVMRATLADGVEIESQAFWDEVLEKLAQTGETPAPVARTTVKDTSSLDDTKPATQATVAVAMRQVLDEREEPKADLKDYQAFFHIGLNLLNPYKITPIGTSTTRKQVDSTSGTEVGGFLEFVYTNRWAWNSGRYDLPDKGWDLWDVKCGFGEWDVQTRLGYNFTKGNEVTANTLVGSSNVNGELNTTCAFLRSTKTIPILGDKTRESAWSLGPELSYAATTDREAMDVHHWWFAGLGYTTSFPSPYDGDYHRSILMHTRMGYANVESVRFLNNSTREIETSHDGTPTFFHDDAWAFEAEILYPMRQYAFLTLGARIYGIKGNTEPDPWNLYIGVTTPISTLLGGIMPK